MRAPKGGETSGELCSEEHPDVVPLPCELDDVDHVAEGPPWRRGAVTGAARRPAVGDAEQVGTAEQVELRLCDGVGVCGVVGRE